MTFKSHDQAILVAIKTGGSFVKVLFNLRPFVLLRNKKPRIYIFYYENLKMISMWKIRELTDKV